MDIFEALRIKIRGDNPPDANKLLQPDKEDGGDADCNTDSPVKVGVELPHQLAGRIAEEKFLADMLAINGVNRCGLFAALRVPYWGRLKDRPAKVVDGGFQLVSLPQTSSKLVSRGEIDLVVASQRGIFVLEIKNWSGTLSTDGMKSHWYQHRRSGAVVMHPNAIEHTAEKAKNLRLHLLKEGCDVPEQAVISRVVFVNPRIDVDPIIGDSGRVIQASDLPAFIASFGRNPLEAAGDRWLPSWLTGCEISAPLVKKAQHILRYTVGTWDVLRLGDGRRLVGDFKDIEPLDIEPRRTAAAGHATPGNQPPRGLRLQNRPLEQINACGGRVKIEKLSFCRPNSDPIVWLQHHVLGWTTGKVDVVARHRKATRADPEKTLSEKFTAGIRCVLDDTWSSMFPWKVATTLEGGDVIVFHPVGQASPLRVPAREVAEIDWSRI